MICLRCGSELPKGCASTRKYCNECQRLRNIQLVKARKIKAEKRQATEREITEEEANRKYCKLCIYYGSEYYGNNLCDYMLVNSTRRGCKYGVGCEKRILKEEKHECKAT